MSPQAPQVFIRPILVHAKSRSTFRRLRYPLSLGPSWPHSVTERCQYGEWRRGKGHYNLAAGVSALRTRL